jgi:hypothetical protein
MREVVTEIIATTKEIVTIAEMTDVTTTAETTIVAMNIVAMNIVVMISSMTADPTVLL